MMGVGKMSRWAGCPVELAPPRFSEGVETVGKWQYSYFDNLHHGTINWVYTLHTSDFYTCWKCSASYKPATAKQSRW